MKHDGLRARLTAFEPADELEATHRARMFELLARPDAFSRSCFDPGHFTASAFVLSPDGVDLLLILHAKLGLWLQPGGHVDPEDVDLLAGARREVEEETGIAELTVEGALLDVDIHRLPPHPKKDEPGHEHFDVRFLFRAASRDFVAGSDALDARWVPLAEVASAGTDESVERAVRKLLRR